MLSEVLRSRVGEYECFFFSEVTLETKVAACGPVDAQPALHVEALLLKALCIAGGTR
jgi:hypothetical protein